MAFTCVPADSRLPSNTGVADVVHVQTMSAPATASASPRRASMSSARAASSRCAARCGSLLTTVTCCTGRTARIAATWDVACTPAPKITSDDASSRASIRVANPDTAAVRSAVNAAPSMSASGASELAAEEDVRSVYRRQAEGHVLVSDTDDFDTGRRGAELAFVAHRTHDQQFAVRKGQMQPSRRRRAPAMTKHIGKQIDGGTHRHVPCDIRSGDDAQVHGQPRVRFGSLTRAEQISEARHRARSCRRPHAPPCRSRRSLRDNRPAW